MPRWLAYLQSLRTRRRELLWRSGLHLGRSRPPATTATNRPTSPRPSREPIAGRLAPPSLGLGGLLLDLLDFLAAVPLRGLPLLRPAPIVRRVETRALEVGGDREEHDLDRPFSADLARFRRRVAHALETFETVSIRAPVLVDRHGRQG